MAPEIDLTSSDDDDDDEVVVQGEVKRPTPATAGPLAAARPTPSASPYVPGLPPSFPGSQQAFGGGFVSPSFGAPSFGGFGGGPAFDPRFGGLAAGPSTMPAPRLPPPQPSMAYRSPAAAHPSQQRQPAAHPASSSGRSLNHPTSASEPIDVDSLPDPPPPPPRPAPPPENKPHLIGMIDTSALIMYPDNPFLVPRLAPGQVLDRRMPKGEIVQQDGEEWARIKVKHKALPPGSAPGTAETINLLPYGAPSSTTEPFGVVASAVANVLGDFLSRGLVRVEGFLKRSRDPPSRMCATLCLYVLTIPPNIKYVSDNLAENSLFLATPKIVYEPSWFQNCAYYNPHISHPGIYDNYHQKKKASGSAVQAGLSQQEMAAQRALTLQRTQVDEVFDSLKGGDQLDETNPGPLINTVLYPHQRKALSFLREREAETRPPTGLSKREWTAPERHSLWEAIEDPTLSSASSSTSSSSGKRSKKTVGWKNKVTEKVSTKKPTDCRGAILADDMGLGKSLSVVSLIASTLVSARKYEVKPLETPPSPSPIVHKLDEGVEDFKGAVFGMPDLPDWTGKGPKKSDREKLIEKLSEQQARRSRIKARTRATLIVCPLTTVSHWEDQLLDHWDGPVTVFASAGGGGTRRNGRAAINARRKKKKRSQDSDSDDSDEDDDKELRVYTYHGNNRSTDPDYLGDFDVVITTYSTLTAEFSKQTKTGEEDGTSTAAASGTSTPLLDGSDSDVQEMDANGQPLSQKKPVKKRKRGKGAVSNLGMAKSSEMTSPLQQLDWFRVVLDEAHFIKDPSTVAARASCYLEAQRRLAITGTPIQNKLDDLWALIKFIRLDPFDDRSVWQEIITTPAKSGNSLGLARLLIIMRHITLRRTKETRLASGKTLLDLPERQDEVRFLRFTEKEQAIYDKYFQDSAKDFNEMIVSKEDGPDAARTNTSYVNILQKILRLRQICDHYLLMTDSSSAAADEDDSSEPLDYETASAAIATHGLTKKRAVSVLAWMKEEAMCECVECKAPMDDLATSLAGLSVGAGEEEAVVKKKGKSKKPFVGILTKCQHLFCIACFKRSVYSGWPKSINGVGRSCPQCTAGLRLSLDCIELVPPGNDGAGKSASSKSSSSRKSRNKRIPRTGEDLVTSSKINHLMEELLGYSKANRFSKNFSGDRNGMQGVSKEGFIQEIDEDEEMDMLVMGDAPEPQDVISAAPGEDLITNPPSTLIDSSTILHGNDPTTKTEPTDGCLPASGIDEPVPSTSANCASSQSTSEIPASAEDEPLPKKEVPDKTLDNANDFSFEGSSNKTILIKDVNDRPPLGEPWETDLASGKPIKSVVFSQWTTMLDRIEDAIVDAGIGYDRLDGSMKLDERVKAMDRLRSDPSCEVLLVSLRAGGVGLNLTAASRVFVMDPYWNPAVENQAVDRVHRLGQTRPVVTVKYIMHDSMEEKMLEVQARKTKVAGMTLAQNISRKELHEQRMEDLKTLFS